MQIILIAAMTAKNHVIGNDNKIPWHYSEDFKHFKKTTTGYPIVMGRKTFESLNNKPLPNRDNIILTKNKNLSFDNGAIICNTLDQVLQKLSGSDKIFIIGGAEIYKLFLPLADQMILTLIKKEYPGNIYFPEFNMTDWKKTKVDAGIHEDFDIVYLEKK